MPSKSNVFAHCEPFASYCFPDLVSGQAPRIAAQHQQWVQPPIRTGIHFADTPSEESWKKQVSQLQRR
jgi:hypothetical protein